MSEPRTADDFWAAAKQIGEAIAAQRAARRQSVKDARNARRRARHRQTPPTPKTVPPVLLSDDDIEIAPGCCCQVVRNPPCVWCTSPPEDAGA